jgi:hypothetical protein
MNADCWERGDTGVGKCSSPVEFVTHIVYNHQRPQVRWYALVPAHWHNFHALLGSLRGHPAPMLRLNASPWCVDAEAIYR